MVFSVNGTSLTITGLGIAVAIAFPMQLYFLLRLLVGFSSICYWCLNRYNFIFLLVILDHDGAVKHARNTNTPPILESASCT